MPELGDQIRTYLDETSQPIAAEDVYDLSAGEEKVRPLARYPERSRISTGLLVAATVALVALLVVGLPMLLSRTDDPDAADVSPSTTFESEPVPTTTQQAVPDVSESVVPGLGTLTWERIDGDDTTLPSYIEGYVDGEYVASSQDRQWRSSDAVEWTLTGDTTTPNEYRWFYARDGWARASDGEQTRLLRHDGDAWVTVEYPDPPVPGVDGVAWRSDPAYPIPFADGLVIPMEVWGEIPWADVYGTFDVPCGEPEPCEMAPWPRWIPDQELLRLEQPASTSVLASLEMVVEGDEVDFVDIGSGDTVLTLRAAADFPIERVVDEVKVNGTLRYAGGYVSPDGGDTWNWVDFPWRGRERMFAMPDGGLVAFDFEYRFNENPEHPLVRLETWTSNDGITWQSHGEPSFGIDGLRGGGVDIQRRDDHLLAFATTGWDGATGVAIFDAYRSADGIVWESIELPFPSHFNEDDANFGTVVSAMPQSRHEFWLSTDGGSTWLELEGPPGLHEPNGAGSGYSTGGAAGDVLFVSFGLDEGSRTLWIGRFVP